MKSPVLSKQILVVDNNETVRNVLNIMDITFTVNYLEMQEPLAQGYVIVKSKRNLRRKSKNPIATERGMEVLYVDFNCDEEEFEQICDELDNVNAWWELYQVDKEIYATQYKNTDNMDFENRKQITKIVRGTYRQAVNSIKTSGGIFYHIITSSKKLPFTKKKPLFFELDAEIMTRYNGGSFTIHPIFDSISLTCGEPLDNFVEALIDTSGAMCGTLMPYILPTMLICILGEELEFDDKKPQPCIDGILTGKIKFTIANDKDMGDLLNNEIKRWLSNPNMTFEHFVKHASMYMFPLVENDSAN
jgi:hypothetical protein